MMKLSETASPTIREIYRRMLELGLNPRSLAARTPPRNETYYRDLFKGNSANPKLANLPGIAKALGCTVEDLLHPGEIQPPPQVSSEQQQAEEIALLAFWRGLSERGKSRVMETIIGEAQRTSRSHTKR